jgi:hypothetical protein
MRNAIGMIITAPEYQFPEGLSVNACLIAVDNIRWQVRCLYNVNMVCECKLAYSKALTRYTCVSLKHGALKAVSRFVHQGHHESDKKNRACTEDAPGANMLTACLKLPSLHFPRVFTPGQLPTRRTQGVSRNSHRV